MKICTKYDLHIDLESSPKVNIFETSFKEN